MNGMKVPRGKRQKKKLSTTDEKIDRLTTIVERRFVAVESKMERGFAAVESKMERGFAAVESKMERGFAAVESKMERGFAAVAEDIADVRNEMATKDDLEKTKEELQSELRLKAGGLSKRLDFETDKRKILEVRVTRLEASR